MKWEKLCEAKEVGGLGFKEIEKFNDALLAKQVWRMINNPGSLCHRVFRARFFPDCYILEAKDSSVGSYAWKSILSARNVIRKGMVWRIGNGESVRIKMDKWLPTQSSRSVISPIPQLVPDAKVSELIDHDSAVWKADLVQQLFLPHEVSVIMGIPLSERLPFDRITWAHTPSGMFTTSSAYKLLIAYDSAPNAGTSNPESQWRFWKSIWQLCTPNKIKHFVWKACQNALPTMANLHRRHIVTTATCEGCKEQPEDPLHALWLCKEISCVWRSMDWFYQNVSSQPVSFSDLFSRFMQSRDDFRLGIFSIIAWLLWNRRNASKFGKPVHPLHNLCSLAGNILQEYLAAQNGDEDPAPTGPIVLQHWRPPDHDSYKVNFDAAIFNSSNSAGIGVMVRDCAGEAIGALSMPIPLPQSVADVEALTCRRAVQFAAEIGLTRVVFEGDSLVIINALTKEFGELATYGAVLEDIRVLASGFQMVEFRHVTRNCNAVADALAKKASSTLGLQVWLKDIPTDIVPLVLRDVH